MAIRNPNGRWTVAKTRAGNWHPQEIKAAVWMLGSTFEGLAKASGLAIDACATAAKRPHFDGEFALAEFLGLSPREIWPSRFRADGTRIPRRRPDLKSSGLAPAGHRQNASAA